MLALNQKLKVEPKTKSLNEYCLQGYQIEIFMVITYNNVFIFIHAMSNDG